MLLYCTAQNTDLEMFPVAVHSLNFCCFKLNGSNCPKQKILYLFGELAGDGRFQQWWGWCPGCAWLRLSLVHQSCPCASCRTARSTPWTLRPRDWERERGHDLATLLFFMSSLHWKQQHLNKKEIKIVIIKELFLFLIDASFVISDTAEIIAYRSENYRLVRLSHVDFSHFMFFNAKK